MSQIEIKHPADRVARRFKSYAELGRIVGVSRNTARNWEKVPTDHHGTLMAAARSRALRLEWWELTMLPDEALFHGLITAEQHEEAAAVDAAEPPAEAA